MTNDSILLPPSSKELNRAVVPVDTPEPSETQRTGDPSRRAWNRKRTFLTVAAVVIILTTLALIWVGARGAMAASAAFAAGEAATDLQTHLDGGDVGRARESVNIIQEEAHEAAALTSDPVWRAVELMPFVGTNLVAIRSGISSLEVVTADALDPLVVLATSLDIDQLLSAGRVERLSALTGVSPQIAEIDAALAAATSSIKGIDATSTIEPLAVVFETVRTELNRYSRVAAGLAGMSTLVPPQISSQTDVTWSIRISTGDHLAHSDIAFLNATAGPNGFSVSEIIPAGSMTDERIVGEELSIPVESFSFLLADAGPQFLPGLGGGASFSAEELDDLIVASVAGDAGSQQAVGERAAGLLRKLVG